MRVIKTGSDDLGVGGSPWVDKWDPPEEVSPAQPSRLWYIGNQSSQLLKLALPLVARVPALFLKIQEHQ
jgi:hypothetical protein